MKQIYVHGEKAYIVLKRVADLKFRAKLDLEPDMEIVKEYRDWIGADHVLRDQTHFIFCETIPDIEYEEILEEEEIQS